MKRAKEIWGLFVEMLKEENLAERIATIITMAFILMLPGIFLFIALVCEEEEMTK